MSECLNRTSVGLKPGILRHEACQTGGPQSNQRGIETVFCHTLLDLMSLPQSNQRGIETERITSNDRGLGVASIEPAWD